MKLCRSLAEAARNCRALIVRKASYRRSPPSAVLTAPRASRRYRRCWMPTGQLKFARAARRAWNTASSECAAQQRRFRCGPFLIQVARRPRITSLGEGLCRIVSRECSVHRPHSTHESLQSLNTVRLYRDPAESSSPASLGISLNRESQEESHRLRIKCKCWYGKKQNTRRASVCGPPDRRRAGWRSFRKVKGCQIEAIRTNNQHGDDARFGDTLPSQTGRMTKRARPETQSRCDRDREEGARLK